MGKNKILSKRMPEGKIARAFGISSLVFRVGGSMTKNVVFDLVQGKKVDLGSLLLSKNNFETITDTLATMRGAAMKLGQIFSMENTDLLPDELSDILSRLRAQGYSMPPKQLKRVLNENWGEGWIRNFRQFESRPFAAASIGQVHKAVNAKGDMLAIKVQFPNIRQSIHSDLNNLRMILKSTGLIPEALDFDHYLEICKTQLLLETDYTREAIFLSRFNALASSTQGIRTPSLFKSLSTKSVLVMSLEEGVQLDCVEEFSEIERARIGLLLVTWTIREIFEFGLIQTDPNFANYRYDTKSGKIKLMDFGACIELSAEVVSIYSELLKSLLSNDELSILNILIKYHLIPKKMPFVIRKKLQNILETALKEFHESNMFSFAESKVFDYVTAENIKEMSAIIPSNLMPADLLLTQRKLIGLTFLLRKLGASLPLKKILQKQLKLEN